MAPRQRGAVRSAQRPDPIHPFQILGGTIPGAGNLASTNNYYGIILAGTYDKMVQGNTFVLATGPETQITHPGTAPRGFYRAVSLP
ncbi:MAG: hypothetical protein O3A87_03735 [Verrucomicrobia bacterium]|nr:hypothetical protein [Verrucomicrobiota bacterium]MDA1005575.1 hypothetical protein [Verrucomicrobiota bacterium]